MMTDRELDKTISDWLETEAPRQLPDRVLNATFEQTRKTRQHGSWRRFLAWFPVGATLNAFSAAAVVLVVISVVAVAFTLGPRWGFGPAGSPAPTATAELTPAPTDQATTAPTAPPTPTAVPTPDPREAFVGAWASTSDEDGGVQWMTVAANPDDAGLTVVVIDTIASVCDGASSTMTGDAAIGANSLVLATPDYRCDDGSEPHLLNGDSTPLNEILRNLTYVLNSELDILTVGEEIWSRQPADAPSPTPPAPVNDLIVGSWKATDNPPDNSDLTMDVGATDGEGFAIEVHDDSAAVCDGTASTMNGVALETSPGKFVIEQPDFRCDDGSEPHELSGPPLAEQLHNYTITYNRGTDQMYEPSGVIWSRAH